MRYITGNNATSAILAEMFNIECGKDMLLPDGKLNPTPKAYPRFTHKGVTVTLRTHIGYIYSTEANLIQIEKLFLAEIDKYTSSYIKIYKTGHLDGYSTLATTSEHFTQAKMKPIDKFTRRFTTGSVKMKNTRFTWYMHTIEGLITSTISNYVNHADQLISIVYDPDGIFTFQNGDQLIRGITNTDIKILSNMLNYTLPKHADMTDVWNKYEGVIPLCPYTKFGMLVQQRHISQYLGVGFVNPKINIQKVPYNPKMINNGDDMVVDIDKKCYICETYLYDDIYIVSRNSKPLGYAFCHICLHTLTPNLSMHFNPITSTVFRTTYPRTLQTALELLEFPKHLQAIIFGCTSFTIDGSAVHLNLNSKIGDDRYIAWAGSILSYYQYVNSNNRIRPLFKDNDTYMAYMYSCKVFKCIIPCITLYK